MTAIALIMAGMGAILIISAIENTNVTTTFDEILTGVYPAKNTIPIINQNPATPAPPEKNPAGLGK